MPIWIWFAPALVFVGLAIWYFFLRALPPKHVPQRSANVSAITRRHADHPELLRSIYPEALTLDAQFRAAAERFGSAPCLGFRRELGVHQVKKTVVQDGQSVEKTLNITKKERAFTWQTFAQVLHEVQAFGHGLATTGLKPGDNVSLYSDTRAEWQKVAQACFAYNFPLVTSYASLGEEALVFSFNQSKCTHVVTNAKLVTATIFPALRKNLAPGVRVVIYTDSLPQADLDKFYAEVKNVQLFSYDEIVQRGRADGPKPPVRRPQPQDVAVIMYTSGSTGNPKGVVISHSNLVAACAGASRVIPGLGPQDTYIAFLPLAHVLELMAECAVLACGGRIGYSHPQQLTDESVQDENGQPCGDFKALQPTVAAAVPLMMDRMRKGVLDRVAKSKLFAAVFNLAYKIKRRLYLADSPSPILDRLVFRKVHAMLGGKLRAMLSGGAPLSAETQEFMNIVFCIPIGQGYGSTETCGAGTITSIEDVTTNTVGPPVPCCHIRLVDVPEMGYLQADKNSLGHPTPRGEIWIGGPSVAVGYYEMPEKTAEDFIDVDGLRWFKTGDIGRWNVDGTLSIIDRKKDLIKLAGGEYVALGSIEAKLKSVPLVENVLVFGDSHELSPVAVVVPNRPKLMALAQELGLASTECEWPAIVQNAKVQAEVLKLLQQASKASKLKPFETVIAVHLAKEEWTPDNKMLTDAMKLKRSEINAFYKNELTALYKKAAKL